MTNSTDPDQLASSENLNTNKDAITETDLELTQQLIDENKTVFDRAMDYIVNLQEFKVGMKKSKAVESSKMEPGKKEQRNKR